MDWSLFFEQGRVAPQPLHGHGVLIHGARQSGKTSFAFQAAVNTVLAGGRATILCEESALNAKLPQPFVSLSALPEAALQRMEFVYVNGWGSALMELMGWTSTRDVPSLLLIDDDGFTEETAGRANHTTHAMALCLSFVENLWDWVSRRGGRLMYAVVTNAFPDYSGRLPLPFTAFPVVSVQFEGMSGVIRVTPMPEDTADPPLTKVTWANNGLRLVS